MTIIHINTYKKKIFKLFTLACVHAKKNKTQLNFTLNLKFNITIKSKENNVLVF